MHDERSTGFARHTARMKAERMPHVRKALPDDWAIPTLVSISLHRCASLHLASVLVLVTTRPTKIGPLLTAGSKYDNPYTLVHSVAAASVLLTKPYCKVCAKGDRRAPATPPAFRR